MNRIAVELGTLLPDIRVRPPGPASRSLAERLRRVESRNVTHVTDDWPVFWDEAVGSNVRDADGNVYIDLTGAFGVALLGHSSPVVREAIAEQASSLIHGMGDVHPPTRKLELLERLSVIAPWDDTRAVLSSTGSEAVETALKTAQLATGKPGAIAFEGAYHGLTLGSLAVTDREHFRQPFGRRLYEGVGFVPFPDPLRDPDPDGSAVLTRIRDVLAAGAPNGDPIGAVLVEPVQARGGARIPPTGFMSALSELARDHDALVIADEVMTGVGRCGSMLASDRVKLRPDLVCLGKALGGGLPISACMGPASVMDAWPESDGEAIHTSTFLGHPLASAAAIAVLDECVADGVPQRALERGEVVLAALREGLAELQGVRDVRGLGLLLGIEFVEDDGAPARGAGARIAGAVLAKGLIALPAGEFGHVLELTPAVGLTDEQIRYTVRVLAAAIREER